LALCPLFKHVTHDFELIIPDYNSLLERFFEGTKLHRLGVDDVLIKNLLDVVIILDQEGRFVRHKIEVDTLPYGFHLIQAHLNIVFLGSSFSYLNANITEFHQAHLKHLAKGESFSRLDFEANFGGNLSPMSFLHTFLS
jgi:hypothetical protein